MVSAGQPVINQKIELLGPRGSYFHTVSRFSFRVFI
jgi:hypothetical protein